MRLPLFRIDDWGFVGEPHYRYHDGKVCYRVECSMLENCEITQVCRKRYKVNEWLFY